MVPEQKLFNTFATVNQGYALGRKQAAENALAQAAQQHGINSSQARNHLLALDPAGTARLSQADAHFDRRMEQDADQFGQRMDLSREQFDHQKQQAAAQLDLQRQRVAIARSNAARAEATKRSAQTMKVAGALVGQVLALGTEEERAAAWPRALAAAKAQGLDLNGVPTEYPGGAAVTGLYNVITGEVWEGGDAKDPIAALNARAAAAGLQPGTPEFQQFMLTNGRGPGMSVTTPDGTRVQMGGSGQKLTEAQGKDVVYANRMAGAEDALSRVELALTSLPDKIAGKVPVLGNYLTDDQYKLAVQAGQEWLSAALRKDSGAALTEHDTTLYNELYLPQPGDTPAVVAQKRQSRARAEEGIRAGLGLAQATMEILDERRAAVGRASAASRGEALPEDRPPDGIDPEIWQFMSDEDKQLWQN